MRNLDRFRGCLIGGAAGDALGYAVEFLGEQEIFSRYGESGITDYELVKGEALISDDTQMTLFTAAGLLRCAASGAKDGYAECVNAAYLDWLGTQLAIYPLPPRQRNTWLSNVPALFCRRAPGHTCLIALQAGGGGTPEHAINRSKGCGGVMRVAPVGLYFAGSDMPFADSDLLGAQAAALTHGHPLGWMPAAALAHIVRQVSQDDAPIRDAALAALDALKELWPKANGRGAFCRLMRKALDLAATDLDDLEAIHRLGEGWVGDEALAIAVYCAVKHERDFDRCLIASVNHKGDSDSTGAIAGNILGAKIGLSGIPAKYMERLELKDEILTVADDLWRDCPLRETGDPDEEWRAKYVLGTWRSQGR